VSLDGSSLGGFAPQGRLEITSREVDSPEASGSERQLLGAAARAPQGQRWPGRSPPRPLELAEPRGASAHEAGGRGARPSGAPRGPDASAATLTPRYFADPSPLLRKHRGTASTGTESGFSAVHGTTQTKETISNPSREKIVL
jgi:hypothetical protein